MFLLYLFLWCKQMVKGFVYFIFILFSLKGYALKNSGEKKFDHYYGAKDPLFFENTYTHELEFFDDDLSKNYFYKRLNGEFYELSSFFKYELPQALQCSDYYYNEYYDYYKYLVRLLTISYLYQSVEEYHQVAYKLNFNQICKVNWKNVFDQCRPKSADMKLFLSNTKQVLIGKKNISLSFDEKKKSSRESWYQELLARSNKDLVQFRISEQCPNKSCLSRKRSGMKKYLQKQCQEDLSLFKSICREEDALYGASYLPEIYPLLISSNTMRVFPNDRLAQGCLKRFISENIKKEFEYGKLKSMFSYLYSKSLDKDVGYQRGRLFAIGALREFVEKGLKEVFEQGPPVLEKKIQEIIVREKLKPRFEEITLPKFKKKKRKKRKVVKKMKEKKTRTFSTFYETAKLRKKHDLEKAILDMKKFKFDFVFSIDQRKTFGPVIKKFSQIKSLKDMRQADKLGNKQAPIPLKFLKYMIDFDNHQGLYNIEQVVGGSFYVVNDIDRGVKQVEFVQIMNNKSTGHKWQIDILRPPQTK